MSMQSTSRSPLQDAAASFQKIIKDLFQHALPDPSQVNDPDADPAKNIKDDVADLVDKIQYLEEELLQVQTQLMSIPRLRQRVERDALKESIKRKEELLERVQRELSDWAGQLSKLDQKNMLLATYSDDTQPNDSTQDSTMQIDQADAVNSVNLTSAIG